MSDINIIKIPSEPIEQILSQPYKTNTVGYFVNVFSGKSKASKRQHNFPSKKLASEFYKENVGKWRIDFSDLSGNDLPLTESLFFNTQEEAYKKYSELMKNNNEYVENLKDDEEDIVIEQLEKSFGQYLPKSIEKMTPIQFGVENLKDDEDGEDDEEEKDEDVQNAESKYLVASSEALNMAKQLLNSISELYIERGVIDKYPYFKNKLYFEENSVQMIHTQMMISQLVLKKFFKQVLKNPTSKNIESLSKIQMSQLAIAKYQREYLSDVEESFKKLKKDYVNQEFVNQAGVEEGEVIVPDVPVINDRKKLIKELSVVTESEELIPLSPNQKLRDNIKSEDKDKYEKNFKIKTDDNLNHQEGEETEKPNNAFESYLD